MFESVRQIVESRLLGLGGDFYDIGTITGETLSSIVTRNPRVRDIDNLKSLNPTYKTFDNNLLIAFGSNTTGFNQAINISGFVDGFLKADDTGANVLALHTQNSGGTGPSIGVGGGVYLVVRNTVEGGTVEDKIDSWVSTINGDSTLGFTARRVGFSMELIPKNRNNAFETESLSVTRDDGFNLSLDYNYLPPRTWTISAREFPLFIEGRQFVQPLNDKFAILSIQDSVSVGREFGNVKDARRRSGSVRIKIYAPHGTGTKVVREMADQFDAILSYSAGDSNTGNGGTLFMKAGSLRQVSENKDGFLEYNLDYIYDYYTS